MGGSTLMTFVLGAAGFFSLMFVAPALHKWCENNPWLRYRLASLAIIAVIGFGSAALLSGWNIDIGCIRYGPRTC